MGDVRVIDERSERNRQSGKFLYMVDDIVYKELSIFNRFKAPLSIWVSACSLALSCALYIPAFATTGWGVVTDTNDQSVRELGLWQYCVSVDDGGVGCVTFDSLPGTYVACQAFACLGLISLITSAVILTSYSAFQHIRKITTVQFGVFVLRPITALLVLITFAVYSSTWYKPNFIAPHYRTELSYSYALAVTVFAFELLASCFMFLDWKQWRSVNTQKRSKQLNESKETTSDEGERYDDIAPDISASPYELFQGYMQERQANYANEGYTNDESDLSNSSRGPVASPSYATSEAEHGVYDFIRDGSVRSKDRSTYPYNSASHQVYNGDNVHRHKHKTGQSQKAVVGNNISQNRVAGQKPIAMDTASSVVATAEVYFQPDVSQNLSNRIDNETRPKDSYQQFNNNNLRSNTANSHANRGYAHLNSNGTSSKTYYNTNVPHPQKEYIAPQSTSYPVRPQRKSKYPAPSPKEYSTNGNPQHSYENIPDGGHVQSVTERPTSHRPNDRHNPQTNVIASYNKSTTHANQRQVQDYGSNSRQQPKVATERPTHHSSGYNPQEGLQKAYYDRHPDGASHRRDQVY